MAFPASYGIDGVMPITKAGGQVACVTGPIRVDIPEDVNTGQKAIDANAAKADPLGWNFSIHQAGKSNVPITTLARDPRIPLAGYEVCLAEGVVPASNDFNRQWVMVGTEETQFVGGDDAAVANDGNESGGKDSGGERGGQGGSYGGGSSSKTNGETGTDGESGGSPTGADHSAGCTLSRSRRLSWILVSSMILGLL